jgi:hypothetical protein
MNILNFRVESCRQTDMTYPICFHLVKIIYSNKMHMNSAVLYFSSFTVFVTYDDNQVYCFDS